MNYRTYADGIRVINYKTVPQTYMIFINSSIESTSIELCETKDDIIEIKFGNNE